jgi:dTDP-4-dehydrorhamnose reductase
MKVLVTGSSGQLGSEFKKHLKLSSSFIGIYPNSNTLNFLKLSSICHYLDKINPEIIVNCAAYTDVEKAESEAELADTINNKAVNIISKWTKKNNKKLVHISTDYVFDGVSQNPLDENSPTNPINEYGRSKLKGEQVCLKNDSNSIVIRTSWLYSSLGNNFVKTMYKLMCDKRVLNVVKDQIGSPTYAGDLAGAIIKIISCNTWNPGVFNYCNEGKISWFDFADDIKKLCNFNNQINAISSQYYSTYVERPKYSLLTTKKIKKEFNIKIPNYMISLRKCIKILQNEK